jgi:hypothetical protein
MSLATTPSIRGKPVATVVVCLENPVVRAILENQADLVVQELLDHLDSPVVLHEFATNQQNHHADNVHPVTLETQDHLENLETADVPATLADLATMDLLAHPDHLDHPEMEETLAETDHPDNLAVQLRANHSSLEILDNLEKMDHLDYLETTDHLEEMDNLAPLETEDHLDQPETLAALEDLATQDPKDHPVCLESAVFAPNIVPWMEVFSSKMEAEERNKDQMSSLISTSFLSTVFVLFYSI